MTAPESGSTPPVVVGATSDAVTLARMEGTLNLIAFQVNNLAPRIETLESDNTHNKSRIQAVEQSMESEARTRVTLAAALKDADEARRAKSDETWTPFQRGIAVLVCCFGAVTILFQAGVFK